MTEENHNKDKLLSELAKAIRKDATIDWSKKENVRARLRLLIKHFSKRIEATSEWSANDINNLLQEIEDSDLHNLEELIKKFIKDGPTEKEARNEESEAEETAVFTLEKYLEEFLVSNWENTPLGKTHDIYSMEGISGQQFPTETGPIDILAISKDKKELLVIELKRGKASDKVVGQILRYMGYIQEIVALEQQKVRGAIIALKDDRSIKYALKMTTGIDFYKYEVKFNLVKD